MMVDDHGERFVMLVFRVVNNSRFRSSRTSIEQRVTAINRSAEASIHIVLFDNGDFQSRSLFFPIHRVRITGAGAGAAATTTSVQAARAATATADEHFIGWRRHVVARR